MSETSGGLPLMAQTQNSRYLTFNLFAWAMDILQTGVLDRDITTPPGSPSEGDAYIVDGPATGAWAGHENEITFYFGGIWNFLSPYLAQGDGIWVVDEGVRLRWNAGSSPPAYEVVGGSPVDSVNGLTGTVSLNGGYIGVKGADIASSGTTDIATATGDFVDVTGTTTITALGTIGAGVERLVRFTGILTLTHHATSLILPTGANITTAAGDTVRFRSLGSGNWVCVSYQRKNGTALAGSGIGGSTGSADNALLRADGTGGSTAQATGVLVSDSDEISGYKGNINTQTGTSYTLVAADTGKIVELTNAAAIALTADPTLPKGFACTIVQGGAGQVTVASTGSGTVVNRQSHTKTAGTNAMCGIYVRSNSGSNAVFVLGGDTAA